MWLKFPEDYYSQTKTKEVKLEEKEKNPRDRVKLPKTDLYFG